MDEGNSQVDLGILEELECFVCLGYMVPPILLCENGHNICNECKPSFNNCPRCTGKITDSRNIYLEERAIGAMYPCTYQYLGCKEVCNLEQRSEHQEQCNFYVIKCPFSSYIENKCHWAGPMNGLKDHAKEKHRLLKYHQRGKAMKIGNKRGNSSAGCYALITKDGDIFCPFWCRTDGKLFGTVYFVGHKNEAEKFRFNVTLDGGEDYENIVTKYFTAPSLVVGFEEALSPLTSACFPLETIENYARDETYYFVLKIVRIEPTKQ